MPLPPRENMPRRLSYRERFVWNLTQTVSDIQCADGLSESDITKIFSALMTGADLSYPEQSHDIVWKFWQWLDCLDTGCTDTQETTRELVNSIYATCEEEEDEMPSHYFQKSNGIMYLVLPCDGCGGNEYYALGSAQQVDPDTNTPLVPSDNSLTISAPSAGANATCYGANAVDYLLSRFNQWLGLIYGVGSTVIDTAFGSVDEVIDVSGALFGLTDNNSVVSQITQSAREDVYWAVAQHRTAYAAAFNLTGTITKSDLRNFFLSELSSISVGGVAVNAWLTNTFLFGVSKDLAKIALDCEAGSGYLTVPTIPAVHEIEIASFEITAGEDWHTPTVTAIGANKFRLSAIANASAGGVAMDYVLQLSVGAGINDFKMRLSNGRIGFSNWQQPCSAGYLTDPPPAYGIVHTDGVTAKAFIVSAGYTDDVVEYYDTYGDESDFLSVQGIRSCVAGGLQSMDIEFFDIV